MEALANSDFWKIIFSADISIVNIPIPLFKIVLSAIVLTLTLALKQVFSEIIIRRIERLTSGTQTTFDDELVKIIKQPLSWLIVIGGLWIVQLILAENFSPDLNEKVEGILRFGAIATFAFIVYRAAPVLGELLKQWTLKSETELDDLLVPYLPKLFQVLAIAIILLKGSEVFLGASASALIGLLGGAGVALGLLLKDLIYDSFCTIIELNPGDGVVLYTDGIPEAYNIDKKQYGIDKLCEVISHNWHNSAEQVKQAIIDDVKGFIGKQKVFDDITLVVLKQQPFEKKQASEYQEPEEDQELEEEIKENVNKRKKLRFFRK